MVQRNLQYQNENICGIFCKILLRPISSCLICFAPRD
ncbi:hypothetical protein GBAR_LOCUS16698, partial [Geodia barretti]